MLYAVHVVVHNKFVRFSQETWYNIGGKVVNLNLIVFHRFTIHHVGSFCFIYVIRINCFRVHKFKIYYFNSTAWRSNKSPLKLLSSMQHIYYVCIVGVDCFLSIVFSRNIKFTFHVHVIYNELLFNSLWCEN